ncbi:MAG: hypothetical protein KC613_24080, partial [Myxococcales bacterium]|nr:hypothetical protein [Myxococcales bacterium]
MGGQRGSEGPRVKMRGEASEARDRVVWQAGNGGEAGGQVPGVNPEGGHQRGSVGQGQASLSGEGFKVHGGGEAGGGVGRGGQGPVKVPQGGCSAGRVHPLGEAHSLTRTHDGG